MDDDDDGEEGITSTTQGLSAATPPPTRENFFYFFYFCFFFFFFVLLLYRTVGRLSVVCSMFLDGCFWVRAASNWSLIPGIAQSKNRQRTVRRLVDYGHREHCNWSIGPSHPWLPFASTISTVDITTLTTLACRALPFSPLRLRYALL